jgi:hypothetical protein
MDSGFYEAGFLSSLSFILIAEKYSAAKKISEASYLNEKA